MSDLNIINISLVILLLPLFGFITVVLFGKKFSKLYLLEIAIIIADFILALYVGYTKLTSYAHQNLNFSFTWIDFGNVFNVGTLHIDLGIKLDNITVLMLFVVTLISMLVHIFSLGYIWIYLINHL